MTRAEEILTDAFDAGFDRAEFQLTDGGYNCSTKSEYLKENTAELIEFAKETAIEFVKHLAKEEGNLVAYLKKVNEDVTEQELSNAMTTFPTSNLSARFKQFIDSQNKAKQP